MPLLDAANAHLLLIDFQTRLMPAIHDGGAVVENAGRLLRAGRRLGVTASFTEQNPGKLGGTVAEVAPEAGEPVLSKMTFDACRAREAHWKLGPDGTLVVAGCETHVCVLQTVLALLARGRRVCVVADAVGSRMVQNRDRALDRMERHGAEIVTTEMVIFEWLETAEHPAFREIVALIR